MRDFTSFKLSSDVSWATYNDEQRCEYVEDAKLHGTLKSEAVQFLIKNQSPISTAYVNLIGLTAGGEGSCKTLTGVDTSRLELTCRSLSR